MIENFWNWIYQSVTSALNVFNTIYANETFAPFFNLLLVIVGVAVVMRFIVRPMLGNSGSDKVKEDDSE